MKKLDRIYKKILLVLVFANLCIQGFSQPFTNSWINYAQSYYKFKVVEKGIYRIDATALSSAGIALSSINPQNIQLFARGEEIPIYIEGEGDGIFDATDFIEFYGEGNDGWFDEPLYGSAENHPSPNYSLFNDTICYFLTFNNSTFNDRIILETDVNFGAFTPIASFFKENVEVYTSGHNSINPYYDGETINIGSEAITQFGFASTEGWFDDDYSLGQSVTKSISSRNAFTSGGDAVLSSIVLGESDFQGIGTEDQHLRLSVGSVVFDTLFAGYKKIDVQLNIPITDLGATTTNVEYSSVDDLNSGAARQTIAHLILKYPHTTDLEGSSFFDGFFIDDNPTESKSLLNFSNFSSAGDVIFYDLTNSKRITVVQNGGNYQCLIPNSGEEKECVISSVGEVINVNTLTAINGTGLFVDHGASPVDTAFIIITHPSLIDGATEYANYRLNPSTNVAPQNAVVYDIEDLYDQFAYGIEKHPLATREFINFIVNTWPTQPNYLFLIGKSIKSRDSRKDLTNFHNNLVPSYGNPASDNMITAGLEGTFFDPLIPTGRLSAKNNTEIIWYLDKIRQHENPVLSDNGETEWMKRFLNFGGGNNSNEQNTFKNYLSNYEESIEGTMFGGNVISFFKTSTAPVQITISDSIKNLISEGVAMMTFFGHASATGGFDQNIDDPSEWPDQQGRYPFLMGLACFAGDVHLPQANSTSETHVLIENAGVIGFLTSVDLSLDAFLNDYASEMFSNISINKYGESIGRQIQSTIRSIQIPNGGITSFTNATVLNITLHGDPALELNTFEKPDYMINNASVTFNPPIINSTIDSFDVEVIVTNLGKAIDTVIVVSLLRSFPEPNFPDTLYSELMFAPHFKDTVVFTLPVDVVKGLGLNTFTVTVDALPGVVDEISENNNIVTKILNIQSGNIVPIYPYNFSIVPNQAITLQASTAFPFQPANNYIFQIDTTDNFNSPVLETTTINQSGGVVSWTPSLLQNMPDSMVYFWRVGKDSVDATGFSFVNSSFQYIPGKEGWEQDHFFQFENNTMQLINHDRNTRQFNFENKLGVLKAVTDGAIGSPIVNGPTNFSEGSIPSYFLDQIRVGGNGVGTNSAIHVAVVDSISLDYWKPLEMNMGQLNVPGSNPNAFPATFFIFRNASSSQMDALASMLNDSIPNGYYVIMWTWYWNMFTAYTPLPANVNTALSNLGALSIPTIQDRFPFVFFAKKGSPLSAMEEIGDSITHKDLSVSATITGSADFANITSSIIGPSTRWDSVFWKMISLEPMPNQDSTLLSLVGVNLGGDEVTLISNVQDDIEEIDIFSQIDANQYPYLKLNVHLRDDALSSAPQIDRWHVIYDDVPEAALDPNVFFSFESDTVLEGENITCSIAVRNIGIHDMDSLLVSFQVLSQSDGAIKEIPYARQRPLLVDSVIILTIEFSTFGLSGLNSLLIDVNPGNDQLEKFHFNNLAEIPFYVSSDNINPLLDVTFDGIHILDGDIVSPQTEIVIELADENEFLLLNDTSDFAVYITDPSGTENRINFTSGNKEVMQFIPATLPRNNAKVVYRANFLVDGKYKLRVQGKDRSANNSGNVDYAIGFEVISKSTITNIINYPNPFTTSTRFVFTLTGSKVPDIFKIQILTITGKVVREIYKEELGTINIGRNISDFAWDGTDKYGDRLANGLYLYRVVTKIEGEDIEHRATGIDLYYKKGYGKMYLFR